MNDEIKKVIETCKKCGEPKMIARVINGAEFLSTVQCKCAREEAEKARQERMKQERKKLKERGWNGSNLENADFKNANKNSIVKKAITYCGKYNEFKNKGILFSGGVGTGKTYTAACMINWLIDNGLIKTFIAISLPEAISMLEKSNDILETLKKVDVVLLDDFGTERNTSYADELTYLIIDTCYKRKKPTLITTNKNVEDFNNPRNSHEERLYSRLWSMCIPLKLSGNDKRYEKLKDEIDEYKKMLGE